MKQSYDFMYAIPQTTSDDAPAELFSFAWLTTEPIRTLFNTAPTGIALFQAIRTKTGQISDFQYRLANPMQYALTNHPPDDLLNLPLTILNPDVVKTGMLDRLIGVVVSGQPSQQVEVYHLDGHIGHYDQIYLKSGDGVLMLVQDITFGHQTANEHRQQAALLAAIQRNDSVADIRARLIALITGKSV